MALIECPECGKKISDHAYMCPNCGFVIKGLNLDVLKQEEARITMEKKIKAYHINESDSISYFEPLQECPKCGEENIVDAYPVRRLEYL